MTYLLIIIVLYFQEFSGQQQNMSEDFSAEIESEFNFSGADERHEATGGSEHRGGVQEQEAEGGFGHQASSSMAAEAARTYGSQGAAKSGLFEGYKDPSRQFSGHVRSYHQDHSSVGGLTAEDIQKAREAKRRERGEGGDGKAHKQMVQQHPCF